MRALITGSGGTVGTALRKRLDQAGWQVSRWNRSEVPIDNYAAMEAFVKAVAPDVLFHLAVASQPTQAQSTAQEAWKVNCEWTSELAWITRQLGVAFVHTSTVMVFTEGLPGPYTVASQPNAAHDYGGDKREAEERVFRQNPDARVVRLGWQIGNNLSGNHMTAWLAAHGPARLSTRWLPACSMLEDTAEAMLKIACARPGLYQIDGNEGWSFYDIACALRKRHGADWNIKPTADRVYDQRMVDPRIVLPPLVDRLPELATTRA